MGSSRGTGEACEYKSGSRESRRRSVTSTTLEGLIALPFVGVACDEHLQVPLRVFPQRKRTAVEGRVPSSCNSTVPVRHVLAPGEGTGAVVWLLGDA